MDTGSVKDDLRVSRLRPNVSFIPQNDRYRPRARTALWRYFRVAADGGVREVPRFAPE